MNLKILPARLHGAVTPPTSKSQAHRLILATALADGVSRLEPISMSQDIRATISCMETLGAVFSLEGRCLTVTGMFTGGKRPVFEVLPQFDCGESGSTLRFLIPVALAVAGGGVFTGHGRLMERPQEPYFRLFKEKGIFYEQKDGILTVRGTLQPGEYALPGGVSSQFFTGLLFALPLLGGTSHLRAVTPLESRDYIAMTTEALMGAGVVVMENKTGDVFQVAGPMAYQAGDRTVEGDWSNAAFWYAAAFLDSQLEIKGLNYQSTQGDACIARLYWTLARPGDAEIDVSQCPDLVPPLAVMAALRGAGKTTRLVNAGRLRIKESDRLATVTQVLTALGAQVEEGPDYLVFTGMDELPGGAVVSGHNDHRIAMMAAVAAIGCSAPVTITGAECVAKSYPDFWQDYQTLGGHMEEV
jgi:3-phosphoshikimate 1-carboxyvinyltransferase